MPSLQRCLYCGKQARPTREHVIGSLIGGTEKIRPVCAPCNSGPLSHLDTELGVRSPISLIAIRSSLSSLHNVWDVDYSADRLLIEGRFDSVRGGIISYPQLIWDETGWQIRADLEEMEAEGKQEFVTKFLDSMFNALERSESGRKSAVIPEKVISPFIPGLYRLPPRIYSELSIKDLAPGSTFKMRFLTAKDKQELLKQLLRIDRKKEFRKFKAVEGTKSPAIQFVVNQQDLLRGLSKWAFNLLVFACRKLNCEFDPDQFLEVRRFVLGRTIAPSAFIEFHGLVPPDRLGFMRPEDGSHKFWLLHDDGRWVVYSSYFGGKVCSYISFKGPNVLRHRGVIEIFAPLGGGHRRWVVTKRSVVPDITSSIWPEWGDMSKVIPNIELTNLRVENVMLRRKTKGSVE